MKVKDLKEWLNKCEDNADIIIDYICSDSWYDYYGTINEIDFDGEDIVLKISN